MLELAASLAIGGSERLIAAIGRGLDPERFHPVFAATGWDGMIGEKLRSEGYVAEAFDRRMGFDRRLFLKVWRLLRRERIDIVQSHHVSSLIYGGPPARLSGAKLVHTEHDCESYDRFPQNLKWIRLLAPIVHRFVAIDPTIADFLHERVGIARRRIHIIRNGIDFSVYRPREPGAEPRSTRTIGWVGRMDPPKRPDLLAEAFVQLAPRYPELRILFVGPGSLLEPTRRRIMDAGLLDRAEFAGGRLDVPDQLRRMDYCVLCSDREGLPFTLVEAMATQLPCIASAVGGIPELFHHGSNGLLFSDGDSRTLANLLSQLLDKPEWAQAIAVEGRRTAHALFDFRTTIEQYTELFLGLAKARN